MPNSRISLSTFGGLKARGHPVGATGVYQNVELTQQLRGEAEENQIWGAWIAIAKNISAVV